MPDYFQVSRRIDDFNRRNGSYEIADSWVWYANGANRDINQLGPLIDPPGDAVKRYQNIVQYRRAALDRLVREFDELKQSIEDNPHGDHEANVMKLKQRQRTVRYRRRQLQEAEDQLRHATTGHTAEEQRVRQQLDAEYEARRQQQREELDAIKI